VSVKTKSEPADANGPAKLRVGARIKRLRNLSGKSLRQVADDLSIAPSALSTLENDHAGVSLQRLQLIAHYYGVTLVDLLAETDANDQGGGAEVHVVRRAHAVTPGVRRGRGVIYQLPAVSPHHLLQTALVSFQPGGGFERDKIGHPGEEIAYVLAGDIQLHLGDTVLDLAQGDLAVFKTETPHAYRNASKLGPAMLLTVATPPW
jgi:quercetin dioxygenase-like cupin family protein